MTDFDDEIMSLRSVPETKEEVLAEVDRYVLLRELGRGAFGAVYLARDTESTLLVALKCLPSQFSHSSEEMQTIKENFALVAKLKHPNIASNDYLHKAKKVQLFKPVVHIQEGDYLLVMEYVQGSVLSQWKKQFPDQKVPVDKAIAICKQVAEALDYAHQQKIIHRDVKPGNVIVDKEVGIKLLDFGLAAELYLSMSRASKDVVSSSGTRAYMSVEQLLGKKQDYTTDQYSLAVMFYELVSGGIPFESVYTTGDLALIQQVTESQEVEPLSELTKSQNKALLKALAKDKTSRFGNCMDFMQALNTEASASAFSLVKGFAGVAAILIAGFTVYSLTKKEPAEEPQKDKPVIITKVLPVVESKPEVKVPKTPQKNIVPNPDRVPALNFKDIVPSKAKADLLLEELAEISKADGFKGIDSKGADRI